VVRSSRERWRYERTEFDGVVIRFTIAKRSELRPGSKITNRFGGKGVISEIRPDALMPKGADGVPVELVVNSLGVNNRMNWAQLYESELNFMADSLAAEMAGMETEPALERLLGFYAIVSPQYHEWLTTQIERSTLLEMTEEIRSGAAPIFVHQPPFFGNAGLGVMADAYIYTGVVPIEFEGIESAMVRGTNYYMKLRHEPSGKFSARSARHLSIRSVPARNSRGVRTGVEHHSTTPIRLGEQELQNLLIANKPEELKRMLRIYATDDVSREGAITELLTRADPLSDARVEARGTGITRPAAGLMALMESIGLRIVGDNEEETNHGTQEDDDNDD
jgi:hypothetical protein